MAMSRRRIDRAGDKQLSLLDLLERSKVSSERPLPGALGHGALTREMVGRALKQCPKSRHQVAATMSELCGEDISKSQLDSWTSESKENHRFPFRYAASLMMSTGDRGLLKALAEAVGCFVVEGEEVLMTELGRMEMQRRELLQKEKVIRDTLKKLKA